MAGAHFVFEQAGVHFHGAGVQRGVGGSEHFQGVFRVLMQELSQRREVQDGHVDVAEHAHHVVDAMAGGNGAGFFVQGLVQGPQDFTNQQVAVTNPAEQSC